MAARIREATLGDARAIAEVHVDGWRWAYRGHIPDGFIDAITVESREQQWAQALSPGGRQRVSVARSRGITVGFASAGPAEDDELSGDTGELLAIYLRSGYEGRGIGRALLAAAEDLLRDMGYRRAVLWVLDSNERARRFYERAGWVSDGTVSTHRFDCAARPVRRYARDL